MNRSNRMKKLVRSQEGYTLIELLVSLAIFAMVIMILYGFLFMSMSMYKRVEVETQVRNQGDVVYGQIVSALRNAVYAEKIENTSTAFRYVIPTNDEEYIKEYEMSFDHGSIEISQVNKDDSTTRIATIDLPSQSFTISDCTFDVPSDNNRRIDLNLTFQRKSNDHFEASDQMRNWEKTLLNLHTSIHLFRND